MTNNYPVVGHLNLRKDDDPPPPDMIVIPPPPPVPPPLIKPTDFIQANGGAAFIAPVAQALPGPTSIPESPNAKPNCNFNGTCRMGVLVILHLILILL